MDNNLEPKSDIRAYIAFPKDWQPEGKQNKRRPRAQYPLMPLILGAGGKLVPIFLDREKLKPLTFNSAREEAEYVKANPEMAAKIAEGRAAMADPLDKLAASNDAMSRAAEKLTEVTTERNALETQNSELRDQLAAARAELEAAIARRNGASSQVQRDDPDGSEGDAPAAATGKKRGRKSKAEILAAQQG